MPAEPTQEMLAWYARNQAAVDRWLSHNPPMAGWGYSRIGWAYLEMPNPETIIGRLLLALGA